MDFCKMKPILFNTDMVRAILDGRKTVTRRLVKKSTVDKFVIDDNGKLLGSFNAAHLEWGGYPTIDDATYQPGDILYVRETWDNEPVTPGGHFRPRGVWYYKADGDLRPEGWRGNWHPSIHMPKWAARLFLRVTDVRVEQLQDITDAGAIAEGIYQVAPDVFINGGKWTYERSPAIGYVWTDGPRNCFRWGLWDTTIKTADLPLYGWDANPWVWVIEFKRISKEAG